MNTPSRLSELLEKYITDSITEDEMGELALMVQDNSNSPQLELFIDTIVEEHPWPASVAQTLRTQSFRAIEEKISSGTNLQKKLLIQLNWVKYAAAILIITGLGAYLWNQSSVPVKKTSNAEVPILNKDILPGSQKAILTLADGTVIELDTAVNGQLITEGNATITKTDGVITYESGGSLSPIEKGGSGDEHEETLRRGFIGFNTMSTPRGGQYQLKLPDGTKVWLNAASSITYPTAFTDKTREVRVTGEAYFEVAANAKQPFIVKTTVDNILVLGTAFNINAYADLTTVKTTLIEGSVKIGSAILKPGQAYANGNIIKTNIEQDIAWKNGFFDFTGLDLLSVTKQLERWYAVRIVFPQGVPSFTFQGKLDRNLNLTQVLKSLEGLGVKYKLNGNELTIFK